MPFKIHKRGEVWHYSGTVAGRRFRGSTRTTVKATAERIAAEREAREWKRNLDGPASILTFAQAANLYIDAHKPLRFVDAVVRYWKDTPVRTINAGLIRASCRVIYPNAGPATWNRAVIVPTQAIVNHAAEQELCQRVKVRRYQEPKTQKEPASWTWVQEFALHSGPRLGALANFMFLTGARISETLSLRWENIDIPSRRALIRQTKIGAERWAHLPPPLVAALANIPGEHTGKVFGYARRESCCKAWRKAIAKAGIPYLSFHSLRHGFATAALQAGIDVVTVAKLGGWKSPAHVFSTYGHASDDKTLTDRLVGDNLSQAKRKSL
jgi:integrase